MHFITILNVTKKIKNSLLCAVFLCVLPCAAFPQDDTKPEQTPVEPITIDIETTMAAAVINNFDLKKVLAQGLISDLTVIEKARAFLPTLNVSYLETNERYKYGADSKQHKVSFDSDITIYDGGKTKLAFDVTRLQGKLGANDYKTAVGEFQLQVKLLYLKILQLYKTIGIQEKTFEQGNIQLRLTQNELQLGDRTQIEAMEVEAQVKEVELNLRKAKNEYTNTLNSLKNILKIHWNQELLLKGDIEKDYTFTEMTKDWDMSTYVQIAIKNRKEKDSAELNTG